MGARVQSVIGQWWDNERWHRRALLVIATGIAITHVVGILITTGIDGPLIQGDGRAYFAYLPSLILDRDLDLRNQFAVLRPEGNTPYPFGVGQSGRAANPFPIGAALLWLPGYAAGLALDAMTGVTDAHSPLGYGPGAVWGSAVWCLLLVGVGAEATRKLSRACVGVREAFPATVMAWVATPALYYTLITPLYSHAAAWFAVSLMLWCTWRAAQHPHSLGLWTVAGLVAGSVVSVRFQDAPLLSVPLIVLACMRYRSDRGRMTVLPLMAWVTGAALGYLVQGLAWWVIHGSWLPWRDMGEFSVPALSDLFGTLFSLGYRGWISWTPLVLPGLIGLVILGRRAEAPMTRWFAWAGLVGIVGMLLLDLIHPYGAGAAFGGRRYVSVTPLLALGLTAFLGGLAGPVARVVAWRVFPLLTVWNLWVLASYELLIIRHGVYPTLLETVRHAAGLGIS